MEVIGYENYLIYEDGKVQNKKTKRYLKPQPETQGYYRICLCKDGKGKYHKLHRLLAEHYIPNPDNKPCVDHINRDRKDNRLENLRWATYGENNQNSGVRKNNKLGIKNISYDKRYEGYRYVKGKNGVIISKYFKTLEEAIEYKKNIEK